MWTDVSQKLGRLCLKRRDGHDCDTGLINAPMSTESLPELCFLLTLYSQHLWEWLGKGCRRGRGYMNGWQAEEVRTVCLQVIGGLTPVWSLPPWKWATHLPIHCFKLHLSNDVGTSKLTTCGLCIFKLSAHSLFPVPTPYSCPNYVVLPVTALGLRLQPFLRDSDSLALLSLIIV